MQLKGRRRLSSTERPQNRFSPSKFLNHFDRKICKPLLSTLSIVYSRLTAVLQQQLGLTINSVENLADVDADLCYKCKDLFVKLDKLEDELASTTSKIVSAIRQSIGMQGGPSSSPVSTSSGSRKRAPHATSDTHTPPAAKQPKAPPTSLVSPPTMVSCILFNVH